MRDLFVGREQELELLHGVLGDADSGRGSLVLLAGEPGIGKSRLADEFSARAEAGGALVAWGRCWELGGAPAYWPWTDALRNVIGERSLDGVEALAQLLPERRDVSIDAAPEHADAARFRLFEAAVRFLHIASAERPLVIVLEDIHTADEPSLLLLEFVTRALPSLRVLILATYRDVELLPGSPFTTALSGLMRDRATTRAALMGLSADDVGELIAATIGRAASHETIERVRSHTEGNPLYVREVAGLLTADGRLPEIGDRLALPRDMREILLNRIRRLPYDCRDVLALAAAIGRDFPLDLLTRIRGAAAVEHLEPATQSGLVVAGEPGQMRFSHAVVSEALYGATAPAQQLQLHREIAETMEALYASDVDAHVAAIAHHYLLALPLTTPEKAVDAAQRAARGAVARLAYEEGARLYRMAIDAAAAVDDAQLLATLLLGLGDAQSRAGDTDGAKATFLDASDRLRDDGSPELFAQAALGYAGRFVWQRAADDVRMVPLLREALARLAGDESVQRVRVLGRLSGAMRDDVSRAPRDAVSLEAVQLAERLDDPAVLGFALTARWFALWGPDEADELRRIASLSLTIAEETRGRERQGEALMNALMMSFLARVMYGETDAAIDVVRRYRALGEELSEPSIRWYAEVIRGIVLLSEGRIFQVEQVLDRTRDLGRRVQAWDSEASYLLALSTLRWEQGRLGEIEAEMRDALVRFPGYRVFRCFLALCYLETGRSAEASDAAMELLEGGEATLPHDNEWLAAMTILAEIASRLDMTAVAGGMYEAMLPYAHLVGSAGGESVTGSMHRPLGQVAALQGRWDDAQQHHERALEMHTRMRAELWVAHSEFDLAEVLRARAESRAGTEAEHLYTRALRRCETLGMTALAARIRAARAERAPISRPGGLTKREVEVAALVATGASNRRIADALVISERTAETHVQNILTKLGFGARSQIAAWVTEQRLQPDPDSTA